MILTIKRYGCIFIIGNNKGQNIIKNKKKYKNMPRLDGTGPMGQGQRTGRGMGFCGTGRGVGRGYSNRDTFGRRRFISPKNELSALENEEKILEEELAAVKEEKASLQSQQK